jgi:hypothetical protein
VPVRVSARTRVDGGGAKAGPGARVAREPEQARGIQYEVSETQTVPTGASNSGAVAGGAIASSFPQVQPGWFMANLAVSTWTSYFSVW